MKKFCLISITIFILLYSITFYSKQVSADGENEIYPGIVVFSTFRDGGSEIFRANGDASGLTRLTYPSAINETPVFSPDGTKVLFARGYNWAPTELRIMDYETGEIDGYTSELVYRTNVRIGMADWSPDGSKIVFVIGNRTEGDLYVIPSDARVGVNEIQPTQITSNNCSAENWPTWSPDGSLIATDSNPDICTYYSDELYLTILNADGSNPRILHDQYGQRISGTINGNHDWSPDGSKILFVKYIDGIQKLFVADLYLDENLAVLNEVPVMSPSNNLFLYGWLPNGKILIGLYPDVCSIYPDGSDLQCFPQFGSVYDLDFYPINPNSPPTIELQSMFTGYEGTGLSIQPTVYDMDTDILSYLWEYSPNDGTCSFSSVEQKDTIFTCNDDGDYAISLKVSDGVNQTVSQNANVTISNVPPIIDSLAVTPDLVPINDSIFLHVKFSDFGTLDIHSSSITWGDGSTTSETVIEENGIGSIFSTHSYVAPGVYEISLKIVDDDGGETIEKFQYAVVYDPSGGFVTGGGWINSPKGAYTPNSTLTGKATFGFVSKYRKGATSPSGSTEFQLKFTSFNFSSTAFDWLVISGAKAQFKGTGTINGSGNYGFMLTAIDGAITEEGFDRFRIKIWDKVTDTIIYDNMIGSSDSELPTTVLEGGSIIIHK